MSALFLVEQSLNGVQLGIMLFLIAAGMTLLLGTMNLLNLAYGSLYMLGAYFGVSFGIWTGSFALAIPLAMLAVAAIGIASEMSVIRPLYRTGHLDQVLCTVGLNLFMNEAVAIAWGRLPLRSVLPHWLEGNVQLLPGLDYSVYRLSVIGVGGAVAIFLYVLIAHTRIGMLIRAGASDRVMVGALGVDIKTLFTLVFGIGAALAALAGLMAAPIVSVQIGMGDSILILTLVVIVIGGLGSVRGAFAAAVLVGFIDTWGRVLLPAAVASLVIYLLMVVVLLVRPRGLFPATA